MSESERPARDLRQRALAYLARREHSRRELARKLGRGGEGCEQDIATLLDKLAGAGLQSDQRFAASLIRTRMTSGHGPEWLRAEFRRHDLGAGAASALAAVEESEWRALASSARRKRFGDALPGAARELARQMRFLQYRGFTSDQVRHALAGRNPMDE